MTGLAKLTASSLLQRTRSLKCILHLRAKPCGTTEPLQHEARHARVQQGFGRFRQTPIVLSKAPLLAQPGERAFYYPPPWQRRESTSDAEFVVSLGIVAFELSPPQGRHKCLGLVA